MPRDGCFSLQGYVESRIHYPGLSALSRTIARWTQNEAARKEAERNRAEAGHFEEPAEPTEPSLSAEYAEYLCTDCI